MTGVGLINETTTTGPSEYELSGAGVNIAGTPLVLLFKVPIQEIRQ